MLNYYVNGSKFCLDMRKDINEFLSFDEVKTYIEYESIYSGRMYFEDSKTYWIHPKLFVRLLQWIEPVKVDKYTRNQPSNILDISETSEQNDTFRDLCLWKREEKHEIDKIKVILENNLESLSKHDIHYDVDQEFADEIEKCENYNYKRQVTYLNATAISEDYKRSFINFLNLNSTNQFLQEHNEHCNMYVKFNEDYWIHPKFFVHLSTWLEPKFQEMYLNGCPEIYPMVPLKVQFELSHYKQLEKIKTNFNVLKEKIKLELENLLTNTNRKNNKRSERNKRNVTRSPYSHFITTNFSIKLGETFEPKGLFFSINCKCDMARREHKHFIMNGNKSKVKHLFNGKCILLSENMNDAKSFIKQFKKINK